jgi:hypothetical protein
LGKNSFFHKNTERGGRHKSTREPKPQGEFVLSYKVLNNQ